MTTPKHSALKFRCADVGVSCGKVTKASSEEELLAALAKHARKAHGVELDETLIDYARSKVRTGKAPAHG
jgi:predicted small metal-binding protein